MLVESTHGATHPTVPQRVSILFVPNCGLLTALVAWPKSVMMTLASVLPELMRIFSGLRSL